MILRYRGSWVQLVYGQGCNGRRLIWWPRFGQISFRLWAGNWLGLHWHIKKTGDVKSQGDHVPGDVKKAVAS